MSVTVSHPEVQVRIAYEDDEGEPMEVNWLQLNVSHSTITSLLLGLGIKGINGHSYSVKVDDVLDALAQWEGKRMDNNSMMYKPTEYQNRFVLKLGMMAMGCKVKGIEEITWG